MKELLSNVLLLLVLGVAAIGFAGCDGGSDAKTASNQQASQDTLLVSNGETKKKSDYPPVPTGVAQSDIKKLDGTSFKVADRTGSVVLLNMWATWCGPCRQEMPALVRMQDAYRDQGFEVVGLNTDDEPQEAITKFAESMKLNYTLAYADTALQSSLVKISQFGGIPQSFLIDRDGNLRGVFKGANPRDIAQMEILVGKVVKGEDTTAESPANAAPNANAETSTDSKAGSGSSSPPGKK